MNRYWRGDYQELEYRVIYNSKKRFYTLVSLDEDEDDNPLFECTFWLVRGCIPYVKIVNVATHPSVQRRGIATYAIDNLTLKSLPYSPVQYLRATPQGYNLYLRLGFIPVSEYFVPSNWSIKNVLSTEPDWRFETVPMVRIVKE